MIARMRTDGATRKAMPQSAERMLDPGTWMVVRGDTAVHMRVGGWKFFFEFQKTHHLLQEPHRAVLTTGLRLVFGFCSKTLNFDPLRSWRSLTSQKQNRR